VLITYKDGTKEMHNVPMNLMYGVKENEDSTITYVVHPEWKWTHPEYSLEISRNISEIKEINIDPSLRLADMNRINNKLVVPSN
jgi:hypothetical protein